MSESSESRGIIMFNRGEKCIVRAIVCLYSLRKHWDGIWSKKILNKNKSESSGNLFFEKLEEEGEII